MEGYIYKIYCDETDKIYIGSTTLKLKNRLIKHKMAYKLYKNNKNKYKPSLYNFFENYNIDNIKIDLIKKIIFENKKDLLKEERNIINEYNNISINKNKPYISNEERENYKKNYYKNNIDKKKNYYKLNRDKILEYKKNYYQLNKDKILEYKKKIRSNNGCKNIYNE